MVLPQAMAWVQYWFRVLSLKFCGKSKKFAVIYHRYHLLFACMVFREIHINICVANYSFIFLSKYIVLHIVFVQSPCFAGRWKKFGFAAIGAKTICQKFSKFEISWKALVSMPTVGVFHSMKIGFNTIRAYSPHLLKVIQKTRNRITEYKKKYKFRNINT